MQGFADTVDLHPQRHFILTHLGRREGAAGVRRSGSAFGAEAFGGDTGVENFDSVAGVERERGDDEGLIGAVVGGVGAVGLAVGLFAVINDEAQVMRLEEG